MEEQMEQWEIDLRSKLEKELHNGYYVIEGGSLVYATGKGGKIEFEVALRKALRKAVSKYIKK